MQLQVQQEQAAATSQCQHLCPWVLVMTTTGSGFRRRDPGPPRGTPSVFGLLGSHMKRSLASRDCLSPLERVGIRFLLWMWNLREHWLQNPKSPNLCLLIWKLNWGQGWENQLECMKTAKYFENVDPFSFCTVITREIGVRWDDIFMTSSGEASLRYPLWNFFFLFYLKQQRDIFHLLFKPQMPITKVRSPKLNLGFPCGRQRPKCFSHHLLPRVFISREMDCERRTWGLNPGTLK